MLAIYAFTIFFSAALLFLVQPMIAKLVLPLLGGTSAVWTTCMLFFQTLLLGGYLYAHVLDRRLAPRTQMAVHVLVALGVAALLPVGLPAFATRAGVLGGFSSEIELSLWLLGVLAVAVGGPFFVVSTTGPLLQRWFSRTGHAHASDPYFLYAASNAGSLLGLGAYPLLVEPNVGVRSQNLGWSIGYGVFAVLLIACGAVAAGAIGKPGPAGGDPKRPPPSPSPATGVRGERTARPSARRVGRWLLLAAAPSSLMLGVTQEVTTDVAAFPLLWIVPLGLYLVSFIIAFSPRIRFSVGMLGLVCALLGCTVVTADILTVRNPLWGVIGLHFLTFFACSTLCHRMLADDRPSTEYLTLFYLAMAGGGAVGGVFNGIVAPLIFDDVYEYAAALVAVLALRPAAKKQPEPEEARPSRSSPLLRRAILPLALLAIMVSIGVFLEKPQWQEQAGREKVYALEPWLRTVLPLAIAGWTIARPLQFAACFAVFAASGFFVQQASYSTELYRERSFFGVIRVNEQLGGARRTIQHGTTMHGVQLLHDETARLRPTSYYHPTGPVGQFFMTLGESELQKRVAVVGLGAGSIAMYSRPGDEYVFYEIDKVVIDVATGTGLEQPYFTFLYDAPGEVEVRLADGRLGLAADPDGHYGVIILDAFSSDAIPVHLLTKDAFELYFRKLVPDGLVLVHVSSRHFELAPVVTRIASEIGCVALLNMEAQPAPQLAAEGKQQSKWMVVGRPGGPIETFVHPESLWMPVEPGSRAPLWTDDWSNVLGVLNLK
ncbi:MAG: hypothetical protein AMXMBFR58_11170 [Phycisphaerae bacterium]